MNKVWSLLFVSLAIVGCSSLLMDNDTAVSLSVAPPVTHQRTSRFEAQGFGAESQFAGYTVGQRRLMAIRASKLDAYRSLAEQIYGVHIQGSTTVSAMMIKHESFRASVDAFIRGARVLSIEPMADGNYVTTLEIEVPESFIFAPINSLTQYSSKPIGAVGPGNLYHSRYY